jgi:hypothetical protein
VAGRLEHPPRAKKVKVNKALIIGILLADFFINSLILLNQRNYVASERFLVVYCPIIKDRYLPDVNVSYWQGA